MVWGFGAATDPMEELRLAFVNVNEKFQAAEKANREKDAKA